MVDTNTTLSVTTGNEVSTLLFGCEYHSWLPGDFKYSIDHSPPMMTQSEIPSDDTPFILPLF